jgi:hypothetical protein
VTEAAPSAPAPARRDEASAAPDLGQAGVGTPEGDVVADAATQPMKRVPKKRTKRDRRRGSGGKPPDGPGKG